MGTTAGDDFGVAVLEEVVIEGHVLRFGENGVVEFEVVLGEHGHVSRSKMDEHCLDTRVVCLRVEMLTLDPGYLESSVSIASIGDVGISAPSSGFSKQRSGNSGTSAMFVPVDNEVVTSP